MILIADSGSTKTDWALCKNGACVSNFQTQGINPFHQSEATIETILRDELLPRIQPEVPTTITSIFFYGAGCTPEKSPILATVLQRLFPGMTTEVQGDLLGAARALCGNEAGIAGILGTGSNSCYYDGVQITKNTPALGYILGDEGSGATLGKRLVGDCLKGQLPDTLCKEFLEHFHLTHAEIIDRVYRQPLANRFLASLSPFLYAHREETAVHQLLLSCFEDFVRRNLTTYPKGAVNLVGSVAHYYKEELSEALSHYGYTLGVVLQRPMDGLIRFHNTLQPTNK